MGSGFEGFDFSHEGVKRVVGLFTGFVSVIASAPHCFLYLNQRIHDIKKNKIKKRPQVTRAAISPQRLRQRTYAKSVMDGWNC